MILQALNQLYDDLAAQGKIAEFGWSTVDVAWIIQIDATGTPVSIIPANSENPKKRRPFVLPMQLKRSGVNAPSYCLCDNTQYVFGVEPSGVTEKSKKAFTNFRVFHRAFLDGLSGSPVQAFRSFLENWTSEELCATEIVQDLLAKKLNVNGPFVFRILGSSEYLHEIPEIRERWVDYFQSQRSENVGACLVMGKLLPIARIHNSVKGIRTNAPSPNGCTLVGFDKDAFNSYGKTQGYNAPVSEQAAFAYTSALNYLLADRDNVHQIGDTTVVCWAQGAEPAYSDTFINAFFGTEPSSGISLADVQATVKAFAEFQPTNPLHLGRNRHFYVLGLAPNAARLSVRFFLRDEFGRFMENINDHHKRMNIVHADADIRESFPVDQILLETISRNAKKKSISPFLSGQLAYSILMGRPYPQAVAQLIRNRVQTDGIVNRCRAGFLKANYIFPRKEIDDMYAFDDSCTDVAYVLGALFSVYERIQYLANPNINATIHDHYFTLAQDVPRIAFQRVHRLGEVQLRQAYRRDVAMANRLSNDVKSLMDKLDSGLGAIPTRFTSAQKDQFIIGYYHRKHWAPTKTNDPAEQNEKGV